MAKKDDTLVIETPADIRDRRLADAAAPDQATEDQVVNKPLTKTEREADAPQVGTVDGNVVLQFDGKRVALDSEQSIRLGKQLARASQAAS